jgi:protein ImuB
MCAHDLAIQLSLQLEAKSLGAQSFHLFLYRVDHKVMTFSVNASRTTRDAGHISRLFANHAERLTGEYDAGFGIDMIRLSASSITDLGSTQIGVFETRDGTENLDQLYDRMISRLGPWAVARSQQRNSHIPERAVELGSVMQGSNDWKYTLGPDSPRPLRLLPNPEPIKVVAAVPDGPPASMIWRHIAYRFIKASGPERIEVEWGLPDFVLSVRIPRPVPKKEEEPDYYVERNPLPSRDYFTAEDKDGRRFWLFRNGLYKHTPNPGWFLHGFFS